MSESASEVSHGNTTICKTPDPLSLPKLPVFARLTASTMSTFDQVGGGLADRASRQAAKSATEALFKSAQASKLPEEHLPRSKKVVSIADTPINRPPQSIPPRVSEGETSQNTSEHAPSTSAQEVLENAPTVLNGPGEATSKCVFYIKITWQNR